MSAPNPASPHRSAVIRESQLLRPQRPRWCLLLTTCGCDLPGISSRVDFGASLSVLGWGLAYGEEAYLLKQPSVGRSLLTRVQIAL